MRFHATSICAALIGASLSLSNAQPAPDVITLERTVCFGSCPAYVLRIDSEGGFSLTIGPSPIRHEEHAGHITAEQLRELVDGFTSIPFSKFSSVYPPTHTDGPTTYITFTAGGETKKVTHADEGPPQLEQLERTIERTTNIHRWLHPSENRYSLQSPIRGGSREEDLKAEMFVRNDIYTRIKPGMTRLMQAAGMEEVEELRRALKDGQDVNAADESGWTALMIAAVAGAAKSVPALLDAGARIDQRDAHGDTALIGAAAVRFSSLPAATQMVTALLGRGASVDATNQMGETALMWAARAGNPGSIRALLRAGANPARTDAAGHDALYYAQGARDSMIYDPSLIERFQEAVALLDKTGRGN